MLKTKITPLYERLSRDDELQAKATPYPTKSYYVEGGFSHLIHMTAAHLW